MARATRLDLDRIGAVASAACAVHCLLTGVALGVMSVVGLGFLASEGTEAAFLGVALLFGTLAIRSGLRKHRSPVPALIFATGLLCWTLSHRVFDHLSPVGTTLAVLGGVCLASFHVVNARLGARCECGQCEAHAAESNSAAP